MSETSGMPKNIFRLLPSSSNRGRDSILVSNPNSIEGEVSQVLDPNKIVFDTGYVPAGEWAGEHQVVVKWYSNIPVGSNGKSSNPGITVQYWVTDENGIESMALSEDVPYSTSFSPLFGDGVGLNYFSETKQHRIVVVSHASLQDGQYVQIDYVKMDVVSRWDTQAYYIYCGDNSTPAVSYQDVVQVTITGDSSTYKFSTTYQLPYTPYWFVVTPCNDGDSSGDSEFSVTNYDYTNNKFTVTCTDLQHVNWSGKLTFTCIIQAWIPLNYI